MAAAGFTIIVDAEGAIALLTDAAEGLPHVVLAQLAEVSELTVEAEKEKAPIGVGGEDGLKGSIHYELIPETLSSAVLPSAPYAAPVEYGSKPHWAPIEPLKAWAELKGMNPYALRWSIAQKGTKPHPYIEPTAKEMAPIVGDKFAEGIAKYVAEFDLARV